MTVLELSHVVINERRAALLTRDRFTLSCQLCGWIDYEDSLDSLDRQHCVDCELLLWDSVHMVENDNASMLQCKPSLIVVQ